MQTAAAILNVRIGGLDQYSQLIVNGLLTRGGTLNVFVINNYLPDVGDSFQILTFGALSANDFATTNGLFLGGNPARQFTPSYDDHSLTLVTTLVQP